MQLPAQSTALADHQHARAAPGSVDAAAIVDGSVGTAEIADNAVTSAKLNDDVYATTVTTIDPDDSGVAGTVGGRLAPFDHQHAITTGTPASVGTANAEGSGSGFARDTHVHGINIPAVRAVWSANTQLLDNTDVAVSFAGTDAYDTDTMHNPSVNPTRITFTTAGVYGVGGYWVMEADAQGARGIYIRKNGTTILAQKKITTAVFGGGPNDAMEISTEDKFAATDYVELVAQNIASGNTLNVTNGAFWASYRTVG